MLTRDFALKSCIVSTLRTLLGLCFGLRWDSEGCNYQCTLSLSLTFLFSVLFLVLIQARREGADPDTDESWSSPDSSDEEEGGPDHVQCMSS